MQCRLDSRASNRPNRGPGASTCRRRGRLPPPPPRARGNPPTQVSSLPVRSDWDHHQRLKFCLLASAHLDLSRAIAFAFLDFDLHLLQLLDSIENSDPDFRLLAPAALRIFLQNTIEQTDGPPIVFLWIVRVRVNERHVEQS